MSARGCEQAHGQPQQRGLAAAIWPDENGWPSRPKRQSDIIENRELADDDCSVLEHDREISDRCPHDHPASCSPARRTPHASVFTTTTIAISTRPSPSA